MLWPGTIFNNNGKEWICSICGVVAHNRSGSCLRRAVRYFHSVERCAGGVRGLDNDSRTKAARNAEALDGKYYKHYLSLLNNEASGSRGRLPSVSCEGAPRSRSRSPNVSQEDKHPDTDIDEFLWKRVAKHFGNEIFFGTVVERIRG